MLKLIQSDLADFLESKGFQSSLGFAGGDENLYRYVGNKATTARDPSGMLDPIRMQARAVVDGGEPAAKGNPGKPPTQPGMDAGTLQGIITEWKDWTPAERADELQRIRHRWAALRYFEKHGRPATAGEIDNFSMEKHANESFEQHGLEGVEALLLERYGKEAGDLFNKARRGNVGIKTTSSMWWLHKKSKTYYNSGGVGQTTIDLRPDLTLGEVAEALMSELRDNLGKDGRILGAVQAITLQDRHGGLLKQVDKDMAEQLDEIDAQSAAEIKMGLKAAGEYYKDKFFSMAEGYVVKEAFRAGGAALHFSRLRNAEKAKEAAKLKALEEAAEKIYGKKPGQVEKLENSTQYMAKKKQSPDWKIYEERFGGSQTPMTTSFKGKKTNRSAR